jgi:hypothetical protein
LTFDKKITNKTLIMKLKHTKVATLTATLITLGSLAGGASGATLITFEETGGSVTATVSGTANLTDLSIQASRIPVSSAGGSSVYANPAFLGIGGSSNFDAYATITGSISIGLGTTQFTATSSIGDFVGIGNGTGTGTNPVDLWLPSGYVSGDSLSGISSWSGESFASIGLSTGTYVWNWGAGASADTLTINVIPEPTSSMFLGLGALGFVARRRRTN